MATSSSSPTESRRRALWRRPVIHFLLLGGLLFIADRWWSSRSNATTPVVVVSRADIDQMRRAWQEQTGTPANAAKEREFVEQAADEQILFREALALGLDRSDPLVRDRLIKLAGFLDLTPETSDDAREHAARALHLEQTDPVIRRYLAQLVQLALAGNSSWPSEGDIQARFAADAPQLDEPARIRLSQVFLGRDRHGDALESDAEQLLARLRHDGVGPGQTASLGDAFPEGSQLGPLSETELTRIFGAQFAATLQDAPTGEWIGPVASVHGVHLVWIQERLAAKRPALEAVRNRLALDLEREQREQRREEKMRALRVRYHIQIQDEPWELQSRSADQRD